MRWLAAVPVLLAMVLGPARAAAEINVADSLEWMVADADVVARGVVVDVRSHGGEGQVVWYRVALRVSEMLEGKPARTLRFVVRHLHGETPEAWKRQKAELLLFLVASQRRTADDPGFAIEPLALRDGNAVLRLRARGSDPAYTLDFARLTTRAGVLGAARRAAAASGSAKRSHRIDVPAGSAAYSALWGGSAVWLVAPVSSDLEAAAQRWLGSSDVSEREQGALALAHFRSPKNVARLRKLLSDPGWVQVTRGNGPAVRRFVVRAAAHRVLSDWGEPVPKTVLERPAP